MGSLLRYKLGLFAALVLLVVVLAASAPTG